jgi:hypothetical protein
MMSGSSVPAALDDLDQLLAAGLVEHIEASTCAVPESRRTMGTMIP